MNSNVPIVPVWPMHHRLLRRWCIVFVGKSMVVVVVADMGEDLVVVALSVFFRHNFPGHDATLQFE